jgi:uncharacterized protein YggE
MPARSLDSGGFGPPMAVRESENLRRALEELGIGWSDVEVSTDSYYGGTSLRVQVDRQDLPEGAEEVEDAIEDVIGNVDFGGLHLVVADCAAALGPAREAAVAEARAAAEVLADSAGVELGRLRAGAETADPFAFFEAQSA